MAYRASNVIAAYIALLALSSLCTYALAVGFGHVNAFVPYLGFLGDQPLESTVFTQLFVIVSVAYACVVQIRYVSVAFRLDEAQAPAKLRRANVASVCVGYVAVSGLFVLACFQESHAYHIHRLAEFLYLFDSVLYCCLQTVVSKKEKDVRSGVRLTLNVFMLAFFVVYLVGYAIAVHGFDKPWEERHHWGTEDGGWLPYILSAISEWVVIALVQCYLLTFYQEFRLTLIKRTAIVVSSQNAQVAN